MNDARRTTGDRRPLLLAGIALGVGLGGFADGIVLHQILQWHNMLASVLAPVDIVSMKVNMFWDGLFHAFTWLVTAGGLALLWRASVRPDARWSGRLLVGGMLAGWGIFNFVEGLIDHQLLGVHHVKPGPTQLAWDLGFLASGILLVAVGLALARDPRRHEVGARRPLGRPSDAPAGA